MPIQTYSGPAGRRTQDIGTRIGMVEDHSGGTLPAHMSLGLAQSELDDNAVQRASRLLSRSFDFSITDYFRPMYGRGRFAVYQDPVTGGPVTLGTARRLLRLHEPDWIQTALGSALEATPAKTQAVGGGIKTERGITPTITSTVPGRRAVAPQRVARVVRAMAPIDGTNVSLSDALGAAVTIARDRKLNIDAFASNLEVTARFPGISPALQVALAHQAARRGIQLTGPRDVVNLLTHGQTAPLFGAQQAVANVRAGLSQTGQKPIGVVVGAGQTTAERQASLQQNLPVGTQAAAQVGQTLTAGLSGADFLDLLRNTQENYVKAAKQIEAANTLHIPFSDSPAGHVVGKIIDYANRGFDAGFRIAFSPFVALHAGLETAIEGSSAQTRRELRGVAPLADLRDAWDIIKGSATAQQEFTKMGVPSWATGVTELAAGIFLGKYIDPVQFALDIVGNSHAANLLAGLEQQGKAESWEARVLQFVDGNLGHIGSFSNVSATQYLRKAALSSRDREVFFSRAVHNFRNYFGAPGLNPVAAGQIFDLAQSAERLGLTTADIDEGIRGVLRAAFGFRPDFGSLAQRIEEADALATRGGAAPIAHSLEPVLGRGGQMELPLSSMDATSKLSNDAAHLQGLLDDVTNQFVMNDGRLVDFIAPQMQEIPHLAGPLGREAAIAGAKLAETGPGAALRAVFQRTPGYKAGDYVHLNISRAEEAIPDYRRLLVRSRVYSPQEIEQKVLRLGQAMDPANYEAQRAAIAILKTDEADILKRINLAMGVRDTTFENAALDAISARVGRARDEMAFGIAPGGEAQSAGAIATLQGHIDDLQHEISSAGDSMDAGRRVAATQEIRRYETDIAKIREGVGGAPIRDPLLLSQLPNEWRVLDPVQYRLGIRETMGTARAFSRAVERAVLGYTKLQNRVAEAERRLREAQAIGDADVVTGAQTALDRAKADASAVAAKIPNARSPLLSIRGHALTYALHRMTERLLDDAFMSWWRPLAVDRPAYILRSPGLGEQTRFLATTGLFSRVESSRTGAKVLSWLDTARNKERYAFDVHVPIEGVEGGERIEHVVLERPGLLPAEPLAQMGGSNRVAMTMSISSEQRNLIPFLNAQRYGEVTREDPLFHDALAHALNYQYGLDSVGRRYMAGIHAGKSEDEIVNDALAYLRDPAGDGPAYAKALMGESDFTPQYLEVQVRRGVHYAMDLTGGSKDIAGRVLDPVTFGKLDANYLRTAARETLPISVHGPLTDEMVLARTSAMKRGLNKLSDWLITRPHNVLSRNPYYKVWYDRSLRGMLDVAKERGIELTPELISNFRNEARLFGVNQVRRVMMDYARAGRLGELTQHFVVFLGPKVDLPITWSRIIRQDPGVAQALVRIGDRAWNAGFIRKDPQTGEPVVPLSWWAGAAPLLAAVTGGYQSPAYKGGGWELVAPLKSFNVFAASTFPLGTPIGDIPIPMPDFNPPVQWALQQLDQHFLSQRISPSAQNRIASWLFAYGGLDPADVGGFLPAWLRHGLEAVFPKQFDSTENNLTTTHFLALMEAQGITAGTIQKAHPGWTREQAQASLVQIAQNHAREFSGFRAFFSLLFPASPQINFPTEPLEQEFRKLIADPKDGGLGYDAGTAEFLRRHPENRLITIARTMWNTDNPAGSPVSIPATKEAAQLLNTAGARKFAQRYPEWAWAIIPSEFRDGTFDPGTFFEQLASGQRQALTPEQFLANADVQAGWDRFFEEDAAWKAWQQTHANLSETDPGYIAEDNAHKQVLRQIAAHYPAWGQRYSTFTEGAPQPNVMAQARQLAANKTFTKTDVGQALVQYLDLRDGIAAQMQRAGVHSIDTTAAEQLGFSKAYDDGVAKITAEHPDFATAMRLFFRGDLTTVKTAGDAILGSLDKSFVNDTLIPWEEQFSQLRDAPNAASTDTARNAAYQAERDYVNQAFTKFDNAHNPILLWWSTRRPDERQQYLEGVATRSYAFLNRFDKGTVLGDPASPATETFWDQYEAARAQITARAATDPNFSQSRAYAALDVWVRQRASSDPQIATQVEHANTWGYAFSKVYADQGPAHPGIFPNTEQSGPYWTAFLDALGTVQGIVNKYGLHGDAEFDPRRRIYYDNLRNKLLGYVQSLEAVSPEFASQWKYLEAQSSDPLISSFMPDTYFPLGAKS